ncbi:uncharacterized protein LOC112528339 [Cynara cardunculus var. scolymus]|uniref:Uncharacterized protein n=1 Tax=Cynara cardunculus var. scolymus TaxID=59895 RepID=A0A118JXK6_CYNCS|nr:uncharacterized protein LOC112528339 [Cynara cardunculus var. scolymus]KVH96054.1 hypothetical protein Ccrd_001851 [Cynara cardunculus var. scolymus]
MCDSFFFCFPSKSKLKCENDPQKPLLILKDDDYDAAVQLHNPTTAMALFLRSWLNGRRLSRKRCRLKSGPPCDVEGGGQVVVEVNLLERYLDDQLGLALEFTCEFDSGDDETDDFYSNRSNLLC